MEPILAPFTVSVTELKRNYSAILKQAEDNPIAVLNHNRPEVYLLSAAHYERLMSYMEDLEDVKLVRERGHGESVLARLRLEGRWTAAGVVRHAQVVEDQANVTRQALDGRGDRVAGLSLDGTDGEAA